MFQLHSCLLAPTAKMYRIIELVRVQVCKLQSFPENQTLSHCKIELFIHITPESPYICVIFAQIFLFAMGYMIFTTVDTAAIENHGELNISVEGATHTIDKRSPIINPLFPVKYPLTLVASKIYSNKIGWLLNKVPGINVIQSLFWGKKGLLALGK